MISMRRRFLVATLAFFASSATQSTCYANEFQAMFDGASLEGWRVSNPNVTDDWTVKDGMIVGIGTGRSYLIYEREPSVADFEMKFSYRLPAKGNTGVNIRARKDETGTRDFQAYHCDLGHVGIGRQVLGAWDFHTPGRTEHRCFRGERLLIDENDKPTLTKIKDAVDLDDIRSNEWNHVHIIAKDNYFSFSINGKTSAEFTEELPLDRRLRRGMIQLQLHDPGMTVYFKDLQLKKINE